MKIQKKLQATANSSNFKTSLATLILFVLYKLGAPVNLDSAGDIVNAIDGRAFFDLVVILVPNVIQPVTKIFGKKLSFAFLKSMNFWVQVATVALVGLSTLGVVFPDNAATSVVDAVFGGDWALIITAITINILSPLYAFFFDGSDGVVRSDKSDTFPPASGLSVQQ